MKLIVDKGRILRLASQPDVLRGHWYFGVRCSGCAVPILLMPDEQNGADPNLFVGEGEFSIPCPRCYADERYPPSAMTSFLAEADARRDPGVEPSNKDRRPLQKAYPGVRPTFGPGALKERPQAAAIIGRCIAMWNDVEGELARLLSTLLGANTVPAIAVFLSLKSSRTQFDALNAAAELVLAKRDLELFQAVMAAKMKIERKRNELAHGRFATAYQIETGVIWLDAAHHAAHIARSAEALDEASLNDLYARCFVYELGDLETIAASIDALELIVGQFIGYLTSKGGDAWRDTQYRRLCAAPLIETELRLIREGQKKTPAERRARSKPNRPPKR